MRELVDPLDDRRADPPPARLGATTSYEARDPAHSAEGNTS